MLVYNFVDDSKGGLVGEISTVAHTIGIFDYDKGIVVFPDTSVYTNLILNYSKMVFDNIVGDESKIVLSPYSHSIALEDDEYPQLFSLALEVGIE